MPTEVLFYHLERQPLDRVLPALLERTLERGWRAVVEAGSEERMTALNALLWTYRADSFLPHGTRQDGMPEDQPVYLTTTPENPNGATVRFLVDGAEPEGWQGYDRIVLIFDGADDTAVAAARNHWKSAKAAGCALTYWQQNQDGRWERKA
ncbi:MAG TPA: DNA polymerase III subunit chi [Hyphomicrobiaceae bacterium]|nr:DNA polymerase III subunit chi [Hyphomicrobiaceae bacterium]